MEIYTNLVWPDDPYRTGQQLYRRPAPRLAAFTVGRAAGASCLSPTSAAMVYLPLHRTKTVAVTQQTVAFGFHAASIASASKAPALARAAGLVLLQARRHAAVLAGHLLGDDLAVLRTLAGDLVPRGIAAVEQEWADRRADAAGRAAMLDCGLDMPSATSLAQACQQARIGISATAAVLDRPAAGGATVATVVHRALVIALVAAWHLDRYTWEGTLHTDEVMAAGTWDCLPSQLPAGHPAATAEAAATPARQPAGAPRPEPE